MNGVKKSLKTTFEKEYNVVVYYTNRKSEKAIDNLAEKIGGMSDSESGYYFDSKQYENFINALLKDYYSGFDDVYVYEGDGDGWTELYHIDHMR